MSVIIMYLNSRSGEISVVPSWDWFMHTFDDSAHHGARQVCFNLLE